MWGGFGALPLPTLEILDSPGELEQLMNGAPIDGIHWPTQVAVAMAIGTDACPPVFSGFELDGRSATVTYRNPGYQACVQPLLSSSTIVAVDRAWLRTIDEIILPESAATGDCLLYTLTLPTILLV